MTEIETDQSKIVNELSNQEKILYSIAISLKRIADKLELSQKQPVIMSAEDYKKAFNL